jgi:uncharacterized protein YjbI with pentapeptide repeats
MRRLVGLDPHRHAERRQRRRRLRDHDRLQPGLARAYLADANLTGANLTGANLAGANLARAYLARANLADANLTGANLTDAYLADAYLARAYLADAYLADANLADAKGIVSALTIGPIGSRGAMLTVTKDDAGMLTVMTGCYRGTLDEFVAAVAKTHGDNDHGRAYAAAVSLIRATIGKETPDA